MALKHNVMARRFKEAKDKLNNEPLSTKELSIVAEIEGYIDKEIFTKFNGDSVSIDLVIANFVYNPISKQTNELLEPRRNLMRKELDKRYKLAGWKVKVVYDDMLDGPNMSGPDLWVISGK